MGEIKFEVLIPNESLYDLIEKNDCLKNKYILSEINDFEDGSWRYERFNNYIMNNVALTTLSIEEQNKIPENHFSSIQKACRNLRILSNDDTGKGSEIAEILLYAVMKDYFHALPAVPKIFYKQNVNDYAKGADGVHIVLNEDDFSLWYREAKFYKDFSSQIDTIVDSVFNSLTSAKIRKENSVMTNLNDLNLILDGNPQKDKILNFLKPDTSTDDIKKKLHIPIMILYECQITSQEINLTDEYKEKIKKEQLENAIKYFQKQDNKCLSSVFNYESITFHLILFPVPNKTLVVDKFMNIAKVLRGE